MRLFALMLLLSIATGCSVATKSTILEKLAADESRRRELFEANLEMLDRKPEYVDEFFQMALHHHATLERFTVNLTRSLADPQLARLTACTFAIIRPAAQRALVRAIKEAFKDPEERKTLKGALKEALAD